MSSSFMYFKSYLAHVLLILWGVDNNEGTNCFNFGHTFPSKRKHANHLTPSTDSGYSTSITGNFQPALPNVPAILHITFPVSGSYLRKYIDISNLCTKKRSKVRSKRPWWWIS